MYPASGGDRLREDFYAKIMFLYLIMYGRAGGMGGNDCIGQF